MDQVRKECGDLLQRKAVRQCLAVPVPTIIFDLRHSSKGPAPPKGRTCTAEEEGPERPKGAEFSRTSQFQPAAPTADGGGEESIPRRGGYPAL